MYFTGHFKKESGGAFDSQGIILIKKISNQLLLVSDNKRFRDIVKAKRTVPVAFITNLIMSSGKVTCSLERITEAVATLYGIEAAQLSERGRQALVSKARRVLIGFSVKHTPLTQSSWSRLFVTQNLQYHKLCYLLGESEKKLKGSGKS